MGCLGCGNPEFTLEVRQTRAFVMKISLNWLRDYLELPAVVDVPAMVRGLVQLGHEVDAVVDAGKDFAHVVVGRIVERVQHPEADRLGVRPMGGCVRLCAGRPMPVRA